MIARILLFIKHRLPWLWWVVDWLNARLFYWLHGQKMAVQVQHAFSEFGLAGFDFRPLEKGDLKALEALLRRQASERLRYFQPHEFDLRRLERVFSNPAFLMFGVFHGKEIVGYFFLRCFWNRKCFVGRLIDEPFEGQGVGRVMNQVMYEIAWRSKFQCMTTISKANNYIVRSHRNNPHARIIGELANDYLLVEFVRDTSADEKTGL